MQATKSSRRASEPPHRLSSTGSHQPRRFSSYKSQQENAQHSLCRNPVLEKERPSQFVHMESHLKELQEELKRTADQLASSEACRKSAQQEAEEAKMKLSLISSKYEDSQLQLFELSTAEDYRIHELRKISQERDKAWQSELAALQSQQSIDMAAWSSVTKEVQKLKSQIQLLKKELIEKDSVIESLISQNTESKGANEFMNGLTIGSCQTESELEEAKAEIADLKSKLVNRDSFLESMVNMNKELNDEIQAQVSQVEAEFNSMISKATVDISELTNESSQTMSKLESDLIEAKAEIVELKSKLVINDVDARAVSDMNKKLTELESELEGANAVIADLKSKIMNRDSDLKSILDMNKKLNNEIRAQVSQVEAEFSLKIAQAAADISELKVRLTDKDAAFKPIEAELRRVKAHSNQWKKAAETAAAILMEGNKGRKFESTGFLDAAENSGDGRNLMNSPISYENGGESPSKKNNNMARMIAGLWKKS